MMNSLLDRFLFPMLVFLTFLFSLISKEILNIDEILINSMLEQYTKEQVNKAMNFNEQWEWLGYVFLPLFILIKVSTIAAILDAGCLFFDREIKYKKLFNIVLYAEFIFLFVILFKTAWFYFIQKDYNLEDLQYFYPLSMLNLIGYKDLQPWFIYPFQVFNLFELVYWLLMAYLIDKELGIEKTKDTGIKIVASSYGVCLLIWVVGVMFFTLNIS